MAKRKTLEKKPVFLRLPEVLSMLQISKAAWWVGIQKGFYPEFVRISKKCVAWRIEDIQKLIIDEPVLSCAEVLEIFPVSRSTWYAGVKEGRYPKTVLVAGQGRKWRLSDINKLNQTEQTKGKNNIKTLDDGNCFICGKDNPIGFKAEFDINPAHRRAMTTVRIPGAYQGWQGITHGGIISALLDEICAQACIGAGMQIVTSEMKLRYRAPVPTGSVVTVIGEVVGERRCLVDVKAKMELDGKIMAEAEVIMYRTDMNETPRGSE